MFAKECPPDAPVDATVAMVLSLLVHIPPYVASVNVSGTFLQKVVLPVIEGTVIEVTIVTLILSTDEHVPFVAVAKYVVVAEG